MNSVLRGAGTATMIALAFALPLSGQTLLRLAPSEGQVSRYVYSMELNVENPMMPTPGPAVTLRAHQTHTVVSVTNDVIRAGTVIDSSAMTQAMPGAGAPPDLSGNALTIEMDPRGRLLSVVSDEAAGAEGQEITEDLLEGTDFFWLPEAEVATGDSWTENVPVPLSMGGPAQTMEVLLTYTLTSLEDDQATITFTGPVETSLDMGGMPASVSGELGGSMVVDLAQGRYVRQESRASLEMAVAGMAVPVETITTLELVTDPS